MPKSNDADERVATESDVTTTDIEEAKHALDAARDSGDPLAIDLARDGLDDLLDRYSSQLSHVTKESNNVHHV